MFYQKKKLGMNLDFISILLGLASSYGLDIFKQFKPEYNYKKTRLVQSWSRKNVGKYEKTKYFA